MDREFLKYVPIENVKYYPQNEILDGKLLPHMWILDRRAYRDEMNRDTREGVLHTNDPNGAKERSGLFSEIFLKMAKSVKVSPCQICAHHG